jgi:hypothetical protein
VTLAAPLAYPHESGVVASSLPANVVQAGVYFCVSQALTRGATATAVQTISGGGTGGGPSSSDDYNKLAEDLLRSYRRVV